MSEDCIRCLFFLIKATEQKPILVKLKTKFENCLKRKIPRKLWHSSRDPFYFDRVW